MSGTWPRLRTALTITVALSFFVVVGWNLEIADDFEDARAALGPNHRGIGMVETLAELIVTNDLGGDALEAFPGDGRVLLSTRIVRPADHRSGWPLLSLGRTISTTLSPASSRTRCSAAEHGSGPAR